MDFKVLEKSITRPGVSFFLLEGQDVKFLVTAPVPAACHVFHCVDNRLNLWDCKQALNQMFSFIKIALVMVCLHQLQNSDQDEYYLEKFSKLGFDKSKRMVCLKYLHLEMLISSK